MGFFIYIFFFLSLILVWVSKSTAQSVASLSAILRVHTWHSIDSDTVGLYLVGHTGIHVYTLKNKREFLKCDTDGLFLPVFCHFC